MNVLREAGEVVPTFLLKFVTHVKKKVYASSSSTSVEVYVSFPIN